MQNISVPVAALAVIVVGLVGLVVAASKRGQEVKLPAGIKVRLDADSATPIMRTVVAIVSIGLVVFGAYLMLVAAKVV